MVNMSQWETAEDIERDLFEYSHLEYPGNSLTPAPPKSISEYRARTQTSRNPGLFDEEHEIKEIFISGRGKHHAGHIIRPGEPVISRPEDDMDLRKKIREVSGLGYSNEIIENMYGQEESTASDEDESDEAISLPNLKLRPYKPAGDDESRTTSEIRKKRGTHKKSPTSTFKKDIKEKSKEKESTNDTTVDVEIEILSKGSES